MILSNILVLISRAIGKWNTHVERICRKTKGVLRFLKPTLAGAPFQLKLRPIKLCPIIKYT